MGRPKKTLEPKEKETALLYAVLKHFPPPIQMSLPQVLRLKRFTDVESNNPGLQKRVQQGASGCTSHGSIQGEKKLRLTSHQAQQERNNNMLQKERKNKVFKLATLPYAEEKCKEKGQSEHTIVKMLRIMNTK